MNLAKNTKLFSLSLLGRAHASDLFRPQMEDVDEMDDGRPAHMSSSANPDPEVTPERSQTTQKVAPDVTTSPATRGSDRGGMRQTCARPEGRLHRARDLV